MNENTLAQNIYESYNITADNNTGEWMVNEHLPIDTWTDGSPLTIEHYYKDYWLPYVYPTVTYYPEKSKIEQAFKILNVLMKKGVVQVTKVKTFVDVVNDIANIL